MTTSLKSFSTTAVAMNLTTTAEALSRGLYNANWIAQGCPTSQYNPDTNVDSSVWTVTSCYATAAMGITLAILILAISSTYPVSPATHSSPSAAVARRRKAREEEKKRKKRLKKRQEEKEQDSNPQSHFDRCKSHPTSSAGPQSIPPNLNHSSSQQEDRYSNYQDNLDEPSFRSWISHDESISYSRSHEKEQQQQSALSLEDGSISTGPKDFDMEPSSEPTVAVLVTHPPPPTPTPTPNINHVSLGNMLPPQIFPPAPPTEANSEPESDHLAWETSDITGSSLDQSYCDDCYTTWLVCYFVFLSTSNLVTGFGHMTGQALTGTVPNRVVHGTAAFAATSLLAVAASEYVRLLAIPKQEPQSTTTQSHHPSNSGNININVQNTNRNPGNSADPSSNNNPNQTNDTGDARFHNSGNRTIFWMVTWMLGSLPAVVIFAVLESNLYTNVFLGAGHFAILLTALFRMCFCNEKQGRSFLLWYLVDAMAMLIYLVGFLVQVFLEDACGYEGYQDNCFAHCPFTISKSALNHNAIYYLCLLVTLLLYGCSKMVQLQPSTNQKNSNLSNTGNDQEGGGPVVVVGHSAAIVSSQPAQSITPITGRASGAAAAVLMQDPSIEI